MEKLLSLNEVEKLIGRKPTTLRLDIRRGRLHAVKINRQFRIKESELKRFMDTARTGGR
ncbi:MAG: helix-turn-helix domain-containing protein [Nitrospira sp.]|nr:helix-turn-helix domain-containing protein [Nitrospira sp.]